MEPSTNNRPYVLWLDQCSRDSVLQVGGKNASLGELMRNGIRVPPGFAVSTDTYQDFLVSTGLGREIRAILSRVTIDNLDSELEASNRIRRLIDDATLPQHKIDALARAYEELCSQANRHDLPVAVRSSATAEDMPGASFAGQQETYLWVTGKDQVVRSTIKCWSSLFTQRAISYRLKMGIPHERALMGVGVQMMVNAKVAGVSFTLNPITGDRSKIAIEASWGLGESVALGEVTPDSFLVDKVTLEILKRTVSTKTIEYVPDPGGRKVECYGVPPERQQAPCLSDQEINEVARLAKVIERHYGRPQDIEWAVDRDLPFPQSVVILQSRPETVWSEKEARPLYERKGSVLEHITANLIGGVHLTARKTEPRKGE